MKKVLLLLACAPYSIVVAENSVKNIMDFVGIVHKQKQEWLDNKKANFDAKVDMLKKHKTQIFDHKNKYMEQIAQGGQINWGDKLHNMIKLYEQQYNDWKELCNAHHKNGLEIGQAHQLEFENFKKAVMPAPEEKEETIAPEKAEGEA